MIYNKSFPVITEKDKQLPFYLQSVGYGHIQEHIDRPSGFPAFQWIQCVEGSGELVIHGRKESIGRHQGMFLFPDVPHSYYSLSGEWKVHWISFDGKSMEQFLKSSNIDASGVFYIKNEEALSLKIKRVLNIMQSNTNLRNIEASSTVYEILMDILMYASKSSNDSTEQQYARLEPVLKFIEDNYSSLITLEDLAEKIGVTPQHLCVLFKNTTRMRPFEYINSVRISKSKDLIINCKELEINVIAGIVGYDNTSYFCSIFKKLEGVSPGKFKKLYL